MRAQSAKAAEMVHAVMMNDVRGVGEILNSNPILEEARSRLIPCFHEVKAAALKAGAYGCTIAGSGPAIVAIADNEEKAIYIRDAMVGVFPGLDPKWLISPIGKHGARVVSSVEDFVMQSMGHHNFF
jgi:homoserine kinase